MSIKPFIRRMKIAHFQLINNEKKQHSFLPYLKQGKTDLYLVSTPQERTFFQEVGRSRN
jgi:hypothetical protein